MLKYNENKKCPKCNSILIYLQWIPQDNILKYFLKDYFNIFPVEEHLKVTCSRCKYFWKEETADKGVSNV